MPSYSVPHDFAEVHRQLEEAVAKLEQATDPDLRESFLQKYVCCSRRRIA